MALFTFTHRETMRYFIDTEFAEEPCRIELISLAIVADDGREFYAESTDIVESQCNPWVRENVLPQLWHRQREIPFPFTWSHHPEVEGGLFVKSCIGGAVKEFIGSDKPEFWGYYADYDWVAFCWLFGSMIDLPKGWPMYCRDIKQVCDERGNPKLPESPTNEHHALADARWNRSALAWLEALPRVG